MSRFLHIAAASLFALSPFSAQAQDANATTVLATVNGKDITLGHLISLYQALPAEYQGLPAQQLYDGLLEQMIQQQVLAETVTEPSLAMQLKIENDRLTALASDAITKIADAAASDEALQKAYDERYANAAPGKEFNAAHILVETKEKAEEILARITAGEDFGAMAKEFSSDTSAQSGGDLGWFGLGMMVKPFEDAVLALKKGDVSGPVESQFGWHLIKLNDERLLETPTLDQVKAQLTNDLRREAVEAELARLVEAAKVERPDVGALDPELIRNIDLLK
jgi:peptidyl-prolyl cis-trans isomerase C